MNLKNKKIPLPVTSSENPSEQLFRDLVNHIPSGVAIFAAVEDGKDFIIRDFNPAAEIIEKVKREDIIGHKVSEVFPGIRKMGLLKVFRRVWKTGQEEHHPITIYKDERIAGWRENYVFKLPSGEIVAIYEDQTEKRQAEEHMAWLASFPEVNPLIVVELDPNNKIRYCNPAALRQFPELMNADINHPFFNQFPKAVQELKDPSRTMATVEVEAAGKWFTQIVCKIFNNPNLRIYAYEITAQKHIEEMHLVLAEIIQASTESDDIHEFLGKVHQAISRVMVAENFFTILFHKDTAEFEAVYFVDQYDLPVPSSRLEKSVSAYVFRTGKPLLLNQALFQELEARGEVEQVGKESPSWLGVPLIIEHETIGVMVVQDYHHENQYSQKDVDFLVSIATEVAKLIERHQDEEEIRKRERRYHSLFEDSPVSLWEEDFSRVKQKIDAWREMGVKDFAEFLNQHPEEVAECARWVRILDVNQTTLSLYKAEKKDELLKGLKQVLSDYDLKYFREELIQIAEGKTHFVWEGVNNTLEGEPIHVQFTWSVVPGFENDLSRVLVSIIDITQQKQIEKEMQRLIQDLRRMAELEKNNRIFAEALANNAITLNSTLSSDEVLDTLMKNIHSVLPSDALAIMMIEDQQLCFVRTRGYAERGLAEWVKNKKFRLDEISDFPIIINNKKYLLTPNCDKSPQWTYIPETTWIKSHITAPLIADDKVIGFLNIDSATPDFFTEEDARKFSFFTEQVSIALRNARLFEDLRRRMDRMQAMTQIDQAINSSLDLNISLEIILMNAKEQLRADAVNILLLVEINQRLVFSKARGFRTNIINKTNLQLGTGLPGKAVLDRIIVQIPDLLTAEESYFINSLINQEGFNSYYCAPLITKGQLKGVLEIYFRQPYHADQEWLEFLETLAQLSAIAINNAELLNSFQAGQFELVNAYENSLQGWSQAIEQQIGNGEKELQLLVDLSVKLAERMGMNRTELANFKRGVLLHDIGMASIPGAILSKPEKLTESEWQLVQAHPLQARSLLSKSKVLVNIMDIPYYHHERLNGSGYPDGLKGKAISLAARIFGMVDVYVALISRRPYRKAWPKSRAMDYLQEQSGKLFDPKVEEIFRQILMDDSAK